MSDLDFSVLLDDLAVDAAQWDTIASNIAKALAIVQNSCDLPDYVIDGLSLLQGLKTEYDDGHTQFETYLKQGSDYIGTIGDTLRTIKSNYEASDEYAEWLLNNAAS